MSVSRITRLVFLGRNALWSMIALVIMLLFYMAVDNKATDGTRLIFSKIKQVGELANVMKNPNYQGLDANNMPYSVMADEAVQQDAETVLLANIRADMATKDGKWLALHAGTGELNITGKTLVLSKNVDMFYDGGYEFSTEQAFVDMAKGSALGKVPVAGQSPMGTIKADRFAVENRGEIIRFEGNVNVTIYRK